MDPVPSVLQCGDSALKGPRESTVAVLAAHDKSLTLLTVCRLSRDQVRGQDARVDVFEKAKGRVRNIGEP